MNEIKLWESNKDITVESDSDVKTIVTVAKQLRATDQAQIINAFNNRNYQMLATYVWSKTITAIKSQLGKMGAAFIGEMLDRPDIKENSNIQNSITEFEAIQLAEDLGLISNRSAFRLKHAMDLVTYFNNPDLDESEEEGFNKIDALQVLVSCIQGVLGHERIELQINFQKFRLLLEEETLSSDSTDIQKLVQSPYFFKRATIRILLSLIKSKIGAQLENTLANTNLIIPTIWNEVKAPERWQIGRSYAELFAEGKSTAVSGLKKVLLKVKGFDYVPEDLRSTSFIKAASDVLIAHEGSDNYYYEPSAIRSLLQMGSVIPTPALPICMSAVLSIKIGNYYGYSWDAQQPADTILSKITRDRWEYYFNDCLTADSRILYKLSQSKPLSRWIEVVRAIENISLIIDTINNRHVKSLLSLTLEGNTRKIANILGVIKKEYGYIE